MRKGYIYYLKCPLKKIPRYVGQTVMPQYRLNKHLSRNLERKKDHFSNWLRLLRDNKLDDKIEMIIIEENESADIFKWMDEREVFWINEFREMGFDLVNHSDGGQGCKGYKHTPEALKKISESSRLRGWKKSEKAKLAISKSLLGNKRRKGKKFTQEQILKISDSLKGKVPWNKGRKMEISQEGKNKQKNGVKEFFDDKRKTTLVKFREIFKDHQEMSSDDFLKKYGEQSSKIKMRLRYYLKHYRNELERNS